MMNDDNEDDNTPLHLAIRNFKGDISPLKLLLERENSDVNVRNSKGETALHLAVKNFSCTAELVKLLLDHGADVKAATSRDGNTALHWIASLNCSKYDAINELMLMNVVRILLEHGIDVNARNLEGNMPLHLACQEENNSLMFVTLLDIGADVDARNFKGDPPFHLYLQCESVWSGGALSFFLKKTRNINGVDSKNETPLHLAVRLKKWRSHASIEMLLHCGADVSKRNAMGDNAVQAYCRFANEDNGGVDPRTQILLRSEEEQLKNSSALHVACLNNRPDSVRELLRLGADVNAMDNIGYTPLVYALIRKHESVGVDRYWTVRLLLDNGADINHRVNFGYTPKILGDKLSLLALGFSDVAYENEHGAVRPPAELFYHHLAKLSALRAKQVERGINVPADVLSEWNRDYIQTKIRLGRLGEDQWYDVVREDEPYNGWLSSCSEELKAMSECKVLGESGKTFLDLLLARAAAPYVKNRELLEAFHEKKAMFPIYQGMLDAKLGRDLERRKLIDRAAVSLSDALEFADPRDEFFERTLSYCSNKDLTCLIDGLAVNR